MKKLFLTLLLALTSPIIFSQTQIITTIAGTGVGSYTGDNGPATSATLFQPSRVTFDAAGNLYIADNLNNVIRKINTSGTITTVAGTGTAGYSGDSGLATSATLSSPWDIDVDASNNLYIADASNNVIRRVDGITGIITTVVGTGAAGYTGDNGPAKSATLSFCSGLAIDGSGNMFIADANNNVIRKVNASTGIITTIAGNGTQGYTGDNGPAISAKLAYPVSMSIDANGNLYFADEVNSVIRKINTSGIITTIAGTGAIGFSGDNGPATSAVLNYPWDAVADAAGNVYIADWQNSRIRKINTSGIITTYAGSSSAGYSGDNGPATSAKLTGPTGVCLDNSGNLIIADWYNNVVRKVSPAPKQQIPSICYLDLVNCGFIDTYPLNSPTINVYAGCTIQLQACNVPNSGPCTTAIWYQNGTSFGFTAPNSPTINFSTTVLGSYVISFSVQPCQIPSQNSTGLGYLTINVIPPPNYLFTATPNPTCVGNSVTFTTDADNPNLYPSSSTISLDFGDNTSSIGTYNNNTGHTTYIHTYSAPGTYNAVLSIQEYPNCLPCSTQITIPIVVNSTPPVCTTPPVFPCGNGGQPIDLSPYFSPPGGIFTSQTGTIAGTMYTPNPGNQYGSNNYVVYNNGCGVCTTQIFIDPPFCQDWQNINNPHNLGGGTINTTQTITGALNNPFYVFGNYTVTGPSTVLTLTGQFLMSPGITIRVTNGATLKIQNAWLHSCCKMWQGIIADNGGTIDIQNGINIIEDAVQAINIPQQNNTNNLLGGKFLIGSLTNDHAIFNKNTNDINIEGPQLVTSIVYQSFVYGSIFTCRDISGSNLYTALSNANFNTLQSNFNAYPTSIPYPVTSTIAGARSNTGIRINDLRNSNTNYFHIGTPGNNKIKNFFDYHDFGIKCLGSTVMMQNNRFQYMPRIGNLFVPLNGVGIYGKGSDICTGCELTIGSMHLNPVTNAKNEFIDCVNGTNINQYRTVYTNGNLIKNSITPTFICFTTGCVNALGFANFQNFNSSGNTYEFDGNTIFNAARGIYVNITNSSTLNNVTIKNNKIDETISNGNYVGAWVEYGGGANTNGTVLVKNNIIRHCYLNALLFRNITGNSNTNCVIVDQNPELSVVNASISSTTKQVIYIDNCPFAQVTNNPEIKTTNNNGGVIPSNPISNVFSNTAPFSTGVFITNSQNSLVSCDTIKWLDACLYYNNNNNNSLFLNNKFDKSQVGLWLDNTAVIGPQIYNPGSLPIGDLWGKWPNRINLYHTLTSNGTNPISSQLYTSAFSGGAFTPQPNPLANNGISAAPYGPTTINTITGVPPQTCPIPGTGCAPNCIQRVFSLSNSLQQPLSNSTVDASTNFHRKVKAYSTIKNDNNQTGYLSDTYLANFYTTSANSNHALMSNAFDDIAARNFTSAISRVNSMSPANSVEQDFKTVNIIALAKMADSNYVFTSGDSAALNAIANKCLFESGMAVSQARALLASITGVPMVYTENCLNYGVGQGQRATNTIIDEISLNESGFIRFYPNPNDGNFTMEYKIQQDATIEVLDVQGKLVCVSSLSANNTISSIACENLENGVYLLKVSISNLPVQTKKLIIAK
ncbi:MAG TPA: T9SS type A sorting domain-containing protein [Bacteroidia bacterium]|jgi:hypothetical protein|nr:T9SS type A sorting domain-containing protein [Bacteroidia bacterium]